MVALTVALATIGAVAGILYVLRQSIRDIRFRISKYKVVRLYARTCTLEQIEDLQKANTHTHYFQAVKSHGRWCVSIRMHPTHEDAWPSLVHKISKALYDREKPRLGKKMDQGDELAMLDYERLRSADIQQAICLIMDRVCG